MGDAAHCSYPFAGNGAAQAIEDGAVLNALFQNVTKRSQIEDALRAYDTVRRPRSQKVVEIARDFGRLYAFALEGVADNVDNMKGFFKEKAAFTNNADLKAQNDEAVSLYEKLLAQSGRGSRTAGEEAHEQRKNIEMSEVGRQPIYAT